MDNICTLRDNYSTLWAWKCNGNYNKFIFSKNPFNKTFTNFCTSATFRGISQDNSTNHKTLLVESYHEHQRLRALIARLDNGSCPLQMLQDDGDWSKDHFWVVIRFLKHSFKSEKIIQLFDMWKDRERSRTNKFNYEKIIELLSEEGQMEDAYSAFVEMKASCLSLSLQVYNSLIHGYAKIGKFDDALFYLNQMKEIGLSPESDTYDGLIQAYGKHKMYDEMDMCLKKMEMDGCSPDLITYNLLIQEYAKAGLLTRMEKLYQSTRMKRMDLRSSTLISMVEAYANFGIVEKMERVLKRTRNLKGLLKEDLIRKMGLVYIENLMFSRLEKLGHFLSKRSGKIEMVWCLLLLSNACMLSQKGMDCVVREMEDAKVSWNITFMNIVLLAYLKMKDLMRLRILLSSLTTHVVKPDVVTVGILFNASSIGFEVNRTLETWKRMRILDRSVEMETDPLVLAAFGKGQFLKNCEDAFSSLEPIAKQKKWTYCDLIDLVAKYNKNQLQLADE